MTFPTFLLLVGQLLLFQHSEQGVYVRAERQHWTSLAGCEAASGSKRQGLVVSLSILPDLFYSQHSSRRPMAAASFRAIASDGSFLPRSNSPINCRLTPDS